MEFVLRMGRALQRHGFSAGRVEEVMVRLAERLGLPMAQVFSTPTSIMAAFGPLGTQSTHLLRVSPGSVSLSQLTQLDRVAADVLGGRISPDAGLERLDEIEAAPPPFGDVVTVLAFALSSAAVARFLGGGWREIGIAAVIGLITGVLALVAARWQALSDVYEPVAAFVASLFAGLASAWALPFSTYTATLAGLIVLIPGFTLTIAVRELSTRHLSSGTARLSAASVTFLGIIFGVAFGTRIAAAIVGPAETAPIAELPGWSLYVAAVLAGLAFSVILEAEWRDVAWVVLAGLVAVVSGRLGARILGLELGSFIGAFIVGTIANLFAHLRNRPSMVMLVPGILMLVPGTIGFRSLSALLEAQVESAVQTAFTMILTAVALVAGLLFADIVSPNRRIG
jgi:uncharacterized membrane protein YjjP (DUF1212 family)